MLSHHTPLTVTADAGAVFVAFASLVTVGGGLFAALSSLLSCLWLTLRLYHDPAIKPRVNWLFSKMRWRK